MNYIKVLYNSLGRYRVLYLLSALELTVIISFSLYRSIIGNIDTYSYYAAYDVLVSGKIDSLRTPLYPFFIGSLKSIFGYTVSKALVFILQSLIFLFSINWLGKTLDNIISNKRVSYWFTAFYALYPGMLSTCCDEMTESLSISLISALIYLVSQAFFHNSFKKVVLSGFICLMLWLLRPSFIPITFIMLVFWGSIWIIKRKKKKMRETALLGFCATLISLTGMIFYAMAFSKEYHKTGVSSVSTWNNYVTIREAGVIDTQLIESPELKAAVDSILKCNEYAPFIEIQTLQNEFGLGESDRFVNNQIIKHPTGILSFLYHYRLEMLLNSNCVFTGRYETLPHSIASITRLFKISNASVFLIFIIAFCILIYNDIKARKISYFTWLLFSIFFESYLTFFLGAPSEFTRLSAPNYPILITLSCWLFDQLVIIATSHKQ